MIDTHCHFDIMSNPEAYIYAKEVVGDIVIGMTNLPSHFCIGEPYIRSFKHVRLALGLHPLLAADKQNELQKKINKNKTMSEEISKLLRESWETNPDNREVYYQFELINVPDTQKELHAQNTQMQQNIEKLTRLICVLQHEEHNTKDYIKSCKEWFDQTFEQELSLNIGNILEKSYNVTQNKKDNPILFVEFIKRT